MIGNQFLEVPLYQIFGCLSTLFKLYHSTVQAKKHRTEQYSARREKYEIDWN